MAGAGDPTADLDLLPLAEVTESDQSAVGAPARLWTLAQQVRTQRHHVRF